jgi:hypothetical protein
MVQVGPSEHEAQSEFDQQRVTHWPFTQVSPVVQSVLMVHSETTCQLGWQMPWSQKSAGFEQFASEVQFAWQVALMHVLSAGQSLLKMQLTTGVVSTSQKPFTQTSPVPQFASVVQAWWHMPPTQSPPPHSPSYEQVCAGSGPAVAVQVPLQQVWPVAHCESMVQPGGGGGVTGGTQVPRDSSQVRGDMHWLSSEQKPVSTQLPVGSSQ